MLLAAIGRFSRERDRQWPIAWFALVVAPASAIDNGASRGLPLSIGEPEGLVRMSVGIIAGITGHRYWSELPAVISLCQETIA